MHESSIAFGISKFSHEIRLSLCAKSAPISVDIARSISGILRKTEIVFDFHETRAKKKE